MRPRAGGEPALGFRLAEPGGTTHQLEVQLTALWVSVYLFFSLQSLPLTLWVAQVPHTHPLSDLVTWVPALLVQSLLRLRGPQAHCYHLREPQFCLAILLTPSVHTRSQLLQASQYRAGIPREAIMGWKLDPSCPIQSKGKESQLQSGVTILTASLAR